MKRGAKLLVKGCDGNACGPFRWTAVREWVAIGYFTPDDKVRFADETDWSPIGAMPELLTTPPGNDTNEPLNYVRGRARETKAVGPRAAAYLNRLGCPVLPQRLNPYTAFQWVRILEELRPHLANATESWAAEEESKDRVPSASPNDATPGQIEYLRSIGYNGPGKLTRLEAQRLISGPPTEGQLRRLRFYGITLPEGACKEEASELIDRYMREHWETEEAYQACRKSLIAEASKRQKPAAPSTFQPSPTPAIAAVVPSPVAQPLTPVRVPAHRASAPQPRRPTVRRYVTVFGLLVLGIIVVSWTISKRNPGADQPHDPQLAGTVTSPESTNRTPGQQLRTFAMSLKVTGILGGAEPRAMIEGGMYRVGDVIDRSQGVFILRVDPGKSSVTFGDKAGNIFERVLQP